MNAQLADPLPAPAEPHTQTPAIADALVVTLCSSLSLEALHGCGLLRREWSPYHHLSARYRRIILIAEGARRDAELAADLPSHCPVHLIHNPAARERASFVAEAVAGAARALADANSVVIRTDQMWGGELATALTTELRRAGKRVGLVARGGYPWSRFVAWEQGPESPFAAEAAATEGELCRAADVVVATTERMLDDLRWRHAIAPDRCAVIPNFIPDDAHPDQAVAREPGTILYAGRLAPQKRLDLLIDAVALLPSMLLRTPSHAPSPSSISPPQASSLKPQAFKLVIIGEGPSEPALRARAADRNLDITFLPRIPQPELLDRMRRCAVYAQTSAFEGHPKTVLEALACAAPVVVADAWGLSDAVVGGITGLIARPDADSVARALARLLADRALAESLGREAARDAERFRFDRVMQLETHAHETAIARAGANAAAPPGAVRWGAELLAADAETAAQAWARSLHGYARRLPPDRRALFCASVDTPIDLVIDQAALESNRGVHPKHHLMRYHDFFVERINEGETVLDLGCGYAEVARSIATSARARVTGMDFSPANLDQARKMVEREGLSARLRLIEGDITRDRATHEDGTEHFDVVILSNVLEHLKDRASLLRQYAVWYTPRTILIRVPAFDRNWQTAWKEKLGVDSRGDDTHETEYTEASLRAELHAAGLTVEEVISRWGEYWVKTGVPQ